MDISGLAAVVAGAASGLGEATARALAAGGAKIVILDRNEEGAKAVGDELGGIGIGCDVADAASMESAIKAAADAYGPARIVVNCAGIGPAARVIGRDGPMDLQKFAQVININLIGTFNTLRLAAAAMQDLDPGEQHTACCHLIPQRRCHRQDSQLGTIRQHLQWLAPTSLCLCLL